MSENKMLNCDKCKLLTEHSYEGEEFRAHSFTSKEQKEPVRADGFKDIWKCRKCGTTRIYGASAKPEYRNPVGRPKKRV
jgi:ribosomal protein L37AE/L43A